VGAVKVALFAKNSGKLNGLQASKESEAGPTATAGKNGKFPASVVPTLVGSAGRSQPPGNDFRPFQPLSATFHLPRLPPVAPAELHAGSLVRCLLWMAR